jgi:hypothetical protein
MDEPVTTGAATTEEIGRHIVAYTTRYAAWLEGQDEPDKIGEDRAVYPCEPDDIDREEGLSAVDLAVRVLRGTVYAVEYSASEFQANGWYAAETYVHPYSGEREEITAHLAGFTADQGREIHARIMHGTMNGQPIYGAGATGA